MKLRDLHEIAYKAATNINQRRNAAGTYGSASITKEPLEPEKQPKTDLVRDRNDGDDDDRSLDEADSMYSSDDRITSDDEFGEWGKFRTGEVLSPEAERHMMRPRTRSRYRFRKIADHSSEPPLTLLICYYDAPKYTPRTYDQYMTSPPESDEEPEIMAAYITGTRELLDTDNPELHGALMTTLSNYFDMGIDDFEAP